MSYSIWDIVTLCLILIFKPTGSFNIQLIWPSAWMSFFYIFNLTVCIFNSGDWHWILWYTILWYTYLWYTILWYTYFMICTPISRTNFPSASCSDGAYNNCYNMVLKGACATCAFDCCIEFHCYISWYILACNLICCNFLLRLCWNFRLHLCFWLLLNSIAINGYFYVYILLLFLLFYWLIFEWYWILISIE